MSVESLSQAQRWFARLEPRPIAQMRLFCLPHAGGGAAVYRPWAALIPPTIELRLVQLPGRETRLREQPYTRMTALIDALAQAVAADIDRPYSIFGHSMGALVAFELAHALRRLGLPTPICLFVSGRRAPQLPDPDSPIHQLSDGPFVGAMIRRYNGIPRVLLEDVELLRLFLPTLRADLELIETYSYQNDAPLDCPISVFGGQRDARASEAELLAWRVHTTAGFEIRQFPGGHFYLQEERAAPLESLIAILQQHLEQP